MKETKKKFNLVEMVKTIIKPANSSQKDSNSKYEPHWMNYRNE